MLDNIPETNFAVPGQAGEEYSNSLGTIKLLSDQNVKGKLQKFCHFVTTLIKYLLYISGDQLKFDETVLKEQSALINILPRANLIPYLVIVHPLRVPVTTVHLEVHAHRVPKKVPLFQRITTTIF